MSLIQQLDAAKDIREEENIGRILVNTSRKRRQEFVRSINNEFPDRPTRTRRAE